jgi:hypothetical protein
MTRRYSTRLLTAVGAALLIPGLAVTGLAGTVLAAAAPHGRISTVVGGRGGPAPATNVSIAPCALTYVSGGLYFSSYQAVVDRVSQRTGLLTPVAGNAVDLPAGPGPRDGTPALAAMVPGACGVTVDGTGNVLVAGGAQVLVAAAKTGTFYRKRMTAGRIYTVASGFEGVADRKGAISGGAVDVQLDSAGNLVIAVAGTQASSHPEGDARVFVYAEHAGTFYGMKMAAGRLYHIGGSLDGYTLVDAVPATRADLGVSIGTVRLDSADNVVVADQAGNGGGPETGVVVPPQVRVIANRTGTFYGQHMKAGYIYTIAGGGTKTGDGVPATGANLLAASGVALDHAGNVLVAAASVRVIAVKSGVFYGKKMTAGDIYTLPGFGVPSGFATSVAVDTAGNVLAAGLSAQDIWMLVERTGSYYGKSLRVGRVYTIAGNGQLHSSGDGGPATSAELTPAAVATLRSGPQTAVADEWAGVVRVVPGRTGIFFGRAMRVGFIYPVASAGQPVSVAYDPEGNLLIADERSGLVRVVACTTGLFYGQKMTAGRSYTVAGGGTRGLGSGIPAREAKFESTAPPTAVATDPAGDVLIIAGDQVWMAAARIGTHYGQAMTAGDIYLVAGDGKSGLTGDGGPATAAEIQSQGVATDGNGNLVLADTSRVRVVAGKTGTFYGQEMTAGHVYLVAGSGTQTGDGTPALKANLGFHILQIAMDPAGNLLAGGYSTVFMVAERTGSFYGKAAHAGDVYTVALSRDAGLLGDGGPAVGAMFNATGIAVAPQAGNLLIADSLTGRVRSVSQ